MPDKHYSIKLDIFEGPMDLLIYLVRKHDVDIYNIPIALITEQFMSYLNMMKSMNIDFASEFLYMAATLAHIKSRMLIPANHPDEDDDPRMEIARPLIEYLRLKSAAEHLSSMNILGQDVFTRPVSKDPGKRENNPGDDIAIGIFELVDAFKTLMDNEYKNHTVDVASETISVKERITDIFKMIEKSGSATFTELFDTDKGKPMMVVTFIALLEMAKMNVIEIKQHSQSGIIRVFSCNPQ